MAIDMSAFDAVMAKIKRREAEINAKTPPKSGWDRLENSSAARKEFAKELDAAKEAMYKSSPGGTYQSFIKHRDPFRGGYNKSQGRYLQLKHQGNTHEQIMRMGYQGTVPVAYDGPGSGPAKSGGIPSAYVAPENRTADEWKVLDPAQYKERYGWKDEMEALRAQNQQLQEDFDRLSEQYSQGFDDNVDAMDSAIGGGGTPKEDVVPATVTYDEGWTGPNPSPKVEDPSTLYSGQSGGGGTKASAVDPTSTEASPGDYGSGGVVAQISVNAEDRDGPMPGTAGANRGHLTRGKRSYYASRFA